VSEAQEAIVFFDGHCNLCNGAVQFIIAHERQSVLAFSSLQGKAFKSLANESLHVFPDSILFYVNGRFMIESDAALEIAKYLKNPWRMLGYLGRVWPRFIRDAVYRYIAKNRYRWFGRRETCFLPTPELKKRFLE
jgi:predicted DCC family thiol-disulfide oxidoreductase YuxK